MGKSGAELIADERRRQVESEGWTPEHDDEHTKGEMAIAAACYTVYHTDAMVEYGDAPGGVVTCGWPWEEEWFKPGDNAIRRLTKAGALIAAEIDRLQRATAPTP